MIKVLLKGPLLTQTGYGHHTRTVLRALRTKEDLFDIYLHPIVWGQTSWVWQDDDERKWIDELILKTQNALQKQIQHRQEPHRRRSSLQIYQS